MVHQRCTVLGQDTWIFKPLLASVTEYGPLWVGHALEQGGSLQLRQRTGIWKLSTDIWHNQSFLEESGQYLCAHHVSIPSLL